MFHVRSLRCSVRRTCARTRSGGRTQQPSCSRAQWTSCRASPPLLCTTTPYRWECQCWVWHLHTRAAESGLWPLKATRRACTAAPANYPMKPPPNSPHPLQSTRNHISLFTLSPRTLCITCANYCCSFILAGAKMYYANLIRFFL